MPLLLVALDGGPDILAGRGPLVVGRHPLCDVRLRSPRVSRRHCYLTEAGGEVWVRDLRSTNGTWINGRRVSSGRLRIGDVLAIAHLRYRVQEVGAEPASWPTGQTRAWIKTASRAGSRLPT
jgi:pSer/pThr/pTyr-binding forkhead associated (FHA) protein